MNIKELREKNKLTQTALAKSLGVSSNAISAIESGRLKLSEKLSGKIKEVYGEIVEAETKAGKKSAAKEVKAAEKKAKTVLETAGAEAVLDAEKKVEKKTRQRKAKVQAAKPGVGANAAAVLLEDKIEKKTRRTKKANIVIQSPMGGEITTDTILERIGEADAVYVRVDQNKAYWVKGEKTGSIDLW